MNKNDDKPKKMGKDAAQCAAFESSEPAEHNGFDFNFRINDL